MNGFKKVLSLFLVAVFICGILPVGANADGTMNLSFVFTDEDLTPISYAKQGDTIYVGIKIDNYTPIMGYAWRIDFDNEILDYAEEYNKSVSAGSFEVPVFTNGVYQQGVLKPGSVNAQDSYLVFAFASASGVQNNNDDGCAFYIPFTVISTGSAELRFNREDFAGWETQLDGNLITTTETDGAILSVTTGVFLEATSISVDGSNGATIDAMAFDTDVVELTSGISWSVSGGDGSGVNINENGAITIDAKAKAGTYTVTATGSDGVFNGENTATATFTVSREPSVISRIEGDQPGASFDNNLEIPADGAADKTVQFSIKAYDQYGDAVNDPDVTWSLSPNNVDGVSLSNDGMLTISNDAKGEITDTTGTKFTISATCGDLGPVTTKVTVKRAAPVATSVDIYKDETAISSDTIAIPQSGSTSVTYTAKVLDQYGEVMSGETATWSEPTGLPTNVTFDPTSGKLTVPAGENTGTGNVTLTASCDSASGTVTINIAKISFTVEQGAVTTASNPVYGMTWGDIVKVTGAITASVGGTPVEGKYSIKDADTIPNAGEQAYTIVFNGSEYNDVTVYNGTVTIAQQTVTVDGITVSDKEYDGNTNAKVSTEGAVVSVKDVTVTSAAGTFADANVGTDKTVTVKVTLDNSNYTVEDLKLEADITPVTLTDINTENITVTKEYDASTSAGTLTGEVTFSGKVGEDDVSVTAVPSAYADANVGSGKTVTLALSLTGDDSGNYTLGSTTTVTFNSAAITACDDITDATSNTQNVVVGVGSFAAPSFTGIGGEAVTGTVTYTYDGGEMDKADIESALAGLNAGATAAISYSFAADGNYSGEKTGTITVTMVDIAFTGVDEAIAVASDAVYGDTWADIVTVDASKIDAAVGTEKVEGTYTVENSNARPNAGSATYRVLFNSTDGKYENVEVDSGTVSIAKKSVTITGLDVSDKVYDGNTTATVTGTAALDGVLEDDTVTVTEGAAAFVDKNVGIDKDVTFSGYGLSGDDAGNYELTAQPSATASITTKSVTITGVDANDKTYDGTATAEISGTPAVSGKVGSDDVNVVNGSATFASVDVGTDISVSFSGFSLSGLDAANYELTAQPESVTADINKANYTGAPELDINVIMNQAEAQTGTLTALNFFGGNMPTEATITNVSLSGTDSNVIESISVDDGSLAYASATNITAAEGTSEAYDVTISTKNYNDITATLTFTTVAKTPVTISGVSVADKVYNGQAASYTGTPVATADGEAVEVSKYTYTWQNTDGTVLSSAPVNAGSYKLVIAVAENDPNYVGSTTVNFTISKATVTITVDDKEAYVGSDMPDFSYIVSGLAAGETLAAYPTLTCSADMDEPGEYTITASGAAVPATGNYNETITYVPGTLTVSRRPINVGPTYDIDVADSENGSVKASLGNASEGSVITLTVTPDEGYRLGRITVIDENGDEVEVRRSGSEYKFTMPDSAVRVSVTFVRGTEALPFNDVNAGDWFYEYVAYVYNNGIMDGVDSNVFSPNAATTRGMVVTVLYRLYGEPAVSGGSSFTDVAPGAYYADAVAWASNAGIVNGTSGTTFSPNDLVTREQFAAMLYRYMQYTGADTSARASLSGFADAGKVSPYAADALAWAVAEGVLNGRSATEIAPQGNCTRAEVAAMITRVFG